MTEKEKIIFALYKDKPVVSAKNFRFKLGNKDVDAYEIYKNIINYQIEKYGSPLSKTVERLNFETKMKLCNRANQRRYYRRNYEKKN